MITFIYKICTSLRYFPYAVSIVEEVYICQMLYFWIYELV